MELPAPGVDRHDVGRARLQDAVGEPARRGAGVEDPPPGRVEVEGVERGGELVATATDVPRRRRRDRHRLLGADEADRVVGGRAADPDGTAAHGRASGVEIRRQAPADELVVELPSSARGTQLLVEAAFLAVVFLAAVFLAVDFFAVAFLAVVFLAVVFLAAVFLAVVFFAVVFLAAAFLAGALVAVFFEGVIASISFSTRARSATVAAAEGLGGGRDVATDLGQQLLGVATAALEEVGHGGLGLLGLDLAGLDEVLDDRFGSSLGRGGGAEESCRCLCVKL